MHKHIKRAIESGDFSTATVTGFLDPSDNVADAAERALGVVAGMPVDQAKLALQIALKAIDTAAFVPADVVRRTSVVSTSDRVGGSTS